MGDVEGNYQILEKFTNGAANSLNQNNQRVKLTLTPNASGGYDAAITVTNQQGEKRQASINNYLTKEEFLSLDTFVFAGKTLVEGNHYGDKLAGIKNVVITKYGTVTKAEDAIVLSEGDVVGIKFANSTEKPFDTQLVLVRYADGRFSSMKVVDFGGRCDEEGYLSVRVTREKPEENKFMIMTLDKDNTLKPLKKAEMVIIN